ACRACNLTRSGGQAPSGPVQFFSRKTAGALKDFPLVRSGCSTPVSAPGRQAMGGSIASSIGLIVTLVLAGCAAAGGQAVATASSCPANHTPACEVSPRDGAVIASSCRCVRTSDVNA